MKSNRLQEDNSSLAGWMFADLFLALTVIFLATVSFVPSGKLSAEGTSGISKLKIQNVLREKSAIILISNGFIGEYKSTDFKAFRSDLSDYLVGKDLPRNTNALYLESVGHTSKLGEPNDSGNLSALSFVINARKIMSVNLDGTTTSISLSPDVEPGYVKIKVTFS